jgi:hypothetical protein
MSTARAYTVHVAITLEHVDSEHAESHASSLLENVGEPLTYHIIASSGDGPRVDLDSIGGQALIHEALDWLADDVISALAPGGDCTPNEHAIRSAIRVVRDITIGAAVTEEDC